MSEMVEKVARAIAPHYGPAFDDCLPNRKAVKDAALKGQANINDNDQEGHLEAARDAIAATDTAALIAEVERLQSELWQIEQNTAVHGHD